MPHAAAMACHGGFGTVRAGLAAGVPLAVLPLFADQPDNAAAWPSSAPASRSTTSPGWRRRVRGAARRSRLRAPAPRRSPPTCARCPPVDAAVAALRTLADPVVATQ